MVNLIFRSSSNKFEIHNDLFVKLISLLLAGDLKITVLSFITDSTQRLFTETIFISDLE